MAERALAISVSSIVLGGAHHVMLPYSLAVYSEARVASGQASLDFYRLWATLVENGDKVFLLLRNAFHSSANQHVELPFTSVVVPITNSQTSSNLCAQSNFTCGQINGKGNMNVTKRFAWMRSSLSSQLEGPFLSPIRIGEFTSSLLDHSDHSQEGYSGVIWEEALSDNLSARWMETILKTTVACSVPLSKLFISLSGRSSSLHACWGKAVEASVSVFVTCTVPYPIFPQSDLSVPLLQLRKWSDDHARSESLRLGQNVGFGPEDIHSCAQWSASVHRSWRELSAEYH